jgi:hypothetical protein
LQAGGGALNLIIAAHRTHDFACNLEMLL